MFWTNSRGRPKSIHVHVLSIRDRIGSKSVCLVIFRMWQKRSRTDTTSEGVFAYGLGIAPLGCTERRC